jgi:hypothetical protein
MFNPGGGGGSGDGSDADTTDTYTPSEDREVTAQMFRDAGLTEMAERVEETQDGIAVVDELGFTDAADRAAALRAIGFSEQQLRDMGDFGGPAEDPVGWTVGGVHTALDDNPIHDQFDNEAGGGFADQTQDAAQDAGESIAEAGSAVQGTVVKVALIIGLALVVANGVGGK